MVARGLGHVLGIQDPITPFLTDIIDPRKCIDQAESPKDQYLLLRALDEVLASLLTLPDGRVRLQEATGDQASKPPGVTSAWGS